MGCTNGHFFNASKYTRCPACGKYSLTKEYRKQMRFNEAALKMSRKFDPEKRDVFWISMPYPYLCAGYPAVEQYIKASRTLIEIEDDNVFSDMFHDLINDFHVMVSSPLFTDYRSLIPSIKWVCSLEKSSEFMIFQGRNVFILDINLLFTLARAVERYESVFTENSKACSSDGRINSEIVQTFVRESFADVLFQKQYYDAAFYLLRLNNKSRNNDAIRRNREMDSYNDSLLLIIRIIHTFMMAHELTHIEIEYIPYRVTERNKLSMWTMANINEPKKLLWQYRNMWIKAIAPVIELNENVLCEIENHFPATSGFNEKILRLISDLRKALACWGQIHFVEDDIQEMMCDINAICYVVEVHEDDPIDVSFQIILHALFAQEIVSFQREFVKNIENEGNGFRFDHFYRIKALVLLFLIPLALYEKLSLIGKKQLPLLDRFEKMSEAERKVFLQKIFDSIAKFHEYMFIPTLRSVFELYEAGYCKKQWRSFRYTTSEKDTFALDNALLKTPCHNWGDPDEYDMNAMDMLRNNMLVKDIFIGMKRGEGILHGFH